MDELRGQALAYFFEELSLTQSLDKTARVFGMYRETAQRIVDTKNLHARDARQIGCVMAWRLRNGMTKRGFTDMSFYYKGKRY